MRPIPLLLLILDGWGHSDHTEHNAIAQGEVPYWRSLLKHYAHTLIDTSGRSVGLPDGQMGNSEVGHMNLGAGRVVYQDFTRIQLAIEDGSFARNPALKGAFDAVAESGTLHVLGLLSAGGVHSHEEQIFALLTAACARGIKRIAVHAFLDGRDTAPRSALAALERLDRLCAEHAQIRLASVTGRYWAMDRDQRWERVASAFAAVVDAQAEYHAESGAQALRQAYARDENDEFVKPTVVAQVPMQDGDAAVFMNFRADRARQLSFALRDPAFSGFARARVPQLKRFVTLTDYHHALDADVAFAPQTLNDTLPEVFSRHGLSQLRIAETEKYAHVTFFFNGGREEVFAGEERQMLPSPKVATYDLQPEMSLPALTDALCAAIESRRFDLIVCNIANGDMVGHTGIFDAALKAVAAVDHALQRIVGSIEQVHGEALITADHGNIEDLFDEASGQPNTQHTTNLVPLVYVGRPAELLSGGALRDIAPTLLMLAELEIPASMTGTSRVVFKHP